jgi:hypothetical protein
MGRGAVGFYRRHVSPRHAFAAYLAVVCHQAHKVKLVGQSASFAHMNAIGERNPSLAIELRQ